MKHLLVVVSALLLALPARADDPMASMPPDIAAIIAKMKAGGRPTADDLAKLKAWQQGVVSHVNVPGGAGGGSGSAQPEGIPCKVRVTLDFTATNKGSTEKGHLEGYTDTTLYAQLGGDADYSQTVLNPAAKASSFRFMPILPKPGATTRPAIGGGSGRFEGHYAATTDAIEGTLSHVAFGVMLTTTGKGDALWATGAGITAQLDGTNTSAAPIAHTTQVHDDDSVATVMGGLAAPFVDEQRHTFQMGQPTPTPTMNLSYRQLADAVRSGKPTTVNGTESFSFTRQDGAKVTGTSSIAITLRPSPLQLVVEPADEKVFKDWVPMPDDSDSGAKPEYFGHPKPLAIHVALHDPAKGAAKSPGPTKPNADVGGTIDINLHDVSTYPGMTMNYPRKGDGDTRPDLYFPQKQPPGIVWDTEFHVHTARTDAVEATVWVAARDTAAYGKVQATIDILGVDSFDPRSKTKAMSVPLDENVNYIADAWEKSAEVGVYDKHPAVDWDEEDTPDLKASKGDGIALIDEYRGFVFAEEGQRDTFQRLSPKTKKLFVMPVGLEESLFKAGAMKFGEITGIKILITRNELAQPWPSGHTQRWVNVNKTPWSRDVTAVRVEDKGSDVYVTGSPGAPGQTWFVDQDKSTTQGAQLTPQDTEWINISRANCQKLVDDIRVGMLTHPSADLIEAARKAHIDLAKAVQYSDPKQDSYRNLVRECMVFSTTHELGHATGAKHHKLDQLLGEPDDKNAEAYFTSGAPSCPMRYWHQGKGNTTARLEWLAGLWDPSEVAPDGHPWRFCTSDSDDWGHMRLK